MRLEAYKEFLSKEASFLAALSAFSYLVAMAYEAGHLGFYSITVRFLSIDTNTIVVAFITLILPFFYITLILMQGRLELRDTDDYKLRLFKKAVTLNTLLWFIALLLIDTESIIQGLILFIKLVLVVSVIILGVPIINSVTKAGIDRFKFLDTLKSVNNFISLENKELRFKLVTSLFLVLTVILLAYSLGFKFAEKQKTFWVIDERPDVFLVANYGSRAIFKSWDTNYEYFTNCIEIIDMNGISIKLRQKTLAQSPKKSPNYNNTDYCY